MALKPLIEKWMKVKSTGCFVSMTLNTTGFTSSKNILNGLVILASWRHATMWTRKTTHKQLGRAPGPGERCRLSQGDQDPELTGVSSS